MKTTTHTPQQAINKAFLKVKINKTDLDAFAQELQKVISHTNNDESEEYHKNLIADFLKHIYPKEKHFINTKGRNDLVVHNDKAATSSVGIIVETKSPRNKSEMPQLGKLNCKALQELVLYYLRERITHKNLAIKHLIITNVHEWFVFDASVFERAFANNKKLVQDFEAFEAKTLVDNKTDFFYQQIASPYIERIEKSDLQEFTHFSLKDYRDAINLDTQKKWIALYKFLSPYHLLKLPFANDSNSLDRAFYAELLHIIGLTEEKDGGKKLIRRKATGEREDGSLLENAIAQIENNDKLDQLDNPKQFGDTLPDRLFNVGLELVITWVNRILFLKLLEAQLLNYHKGDETFTFLQLEKVRNFNDLNQLFFSVLARRLDDRPSRVRPTFDHVPYLNSSLFEQTDLENKTLFINGLDSEATLRIHPATVLKDHNGKKRTGALPALEYLFAFLNAYDFSSEGAGDVQEDNKTLINASVLGLIFEKINGYKDGSFFTPGFITMYMCRETIRKAVLQKFEDIKGWKCATINELEDKIEDRQEANQIINSLKICDPAVGSGHFLVSALNELIAVKSELGILLDRKGKRLKNYTLEVANDELTITDEDGELFAYRPKSSESQRVQETLFHEKQTLIENCLFGVDINPNSVKICRLRLWVELLKNAYYKSDTELETLPNIDINIKCGNSLISRFELDDSLKTAFKSKENPYSLQDYKNKVNEYKKTNSKDDKREILNIISTIKSAFKDTLNKKFLSKLAHARGEYERQQQHLQNLEVFGQAVSKKEKDELKRVHLNFEKAKAEKEEILTNAIYENAFEWRFEFPEVLNDDGDFIGFDAIIGNPPYMRVQEIQASQPTQKGYYEEKYSNAKGAYDLANIFFELAIRIARPLSHNSFIFPHKFFNADSSTTFRTYLEAGKFIDEIAHFGANMIFDDADTYTCIAQFSKIPNNGFWFQRFAFKSDFQRLIKQREKYSFVPYTKLNQASTLYGNNQWILFDDIRGFDVFDKIYNQKSSIKEKFARVSQGIATGKDELYLLFGIENNGFVIGSFPKNDKIYHIERGILKPFLKGKNVHRFALPEYGLFILFPYKLNANGKAEPLLENDIKNMYPNAYQWLKETEDLHRKKDNKSTNDALWYRYARSQGIDYIERPKLSSMEICSTCPNVILNNQNFYHTTTVYSWVKKDSTLESYEYLLAIANSSLLWWFMKITGDTLQGDARRFMTRYLNPFPLPETVSETDEAAIVAKVKQVLSTKQADPAADTSALEKEIDALVYALYGLTEEEIAVVERGQ